MYLGAIKENVVADPEQRAKELIKLLKSKKYTISKGAISKTKHGKSVYFYVDYKNKYVNHNLGRGLKVRVSDHGVTNVSRMQNEFHFGTEQNKHRKLLDEMTMNEIDRAMKK